MLYLQESRKMAAGEEISYDLRDIRLDRPTKEELADWHQKSGLELKRFFNTSGNLYKELKLKDRLPGMTDEEKLELLATDGMLVKRPIFVSEDRVLVGFKEKEWEEISVQTSGAPQA